MKRLFNTGCRLLTVTLLLLLVGIQSAGAQEQTLPRLLDLGADKCVPCKMMAPILEELAQQYAGQLQVEFIDVWKHPEAARPYGVRLIPTQIFFDPQGKELYRHQGFYGKAEILTKWRELGYDLTRH